MDMEDVVMKLIGPTRPIGDSNEDLHRLNNTRKLTELIGRLLKTVGDLSTYDNRHEASMRLIGIHAGEFLDDEISCLTDLRGCPSCAEHEAIERELLEIAREYAHSSKLESVDMFHIQTVFDRIIRIIRRRSKDEGG